MGPEIGPSSGYVNPFHGHRNRFNKKEIKTSISQYLEHGSIGTI